MLGECSCTSGTQPALHPSSSTHLRLLAHVRVLLRVLICVGTDTGCGLLLPTVYSGPEQVTSDMQFTRAHDRLTRITDQRGSPGLPGQGRTRNATVGPTGPAEGYCRADRPGPRPGERVGEEGAVSCALQASQEAAPGAPVLSVMAVGGGVRECGGSQALLQSLQPLPDSLPKALLL